jgi:Icc protein
MIVAQISDTHIRRKGRLLYNLVDTAKYLRRCVARLNGLDPRPDVVLATGDLVEAGKPKEYRRLRKILAELELPIHVIPGNHDVVEHLRDAFPDHAYLHGDSPGIRYVVDGHDVRLIGLDSTSPGKVGGVLDGDRLAWLDARLMEAPARPTLLFMHHPPFKTGIRPIDAPGFVGIERLADIVRRHPQIERIACGHIHRSMQMRWCGTIACTAPSTAHQFVLDLRERHPLGFVLEPAGFLLHVWQDGAMMTHACFVDGFGGAHALRS